MANAAGRVTLLPRLVALLALSGTAFGFRFPTSRRCALLSDNDCLPGNFTQDLPAAVKSASAQCLVRSALGGLGRGSWRRRGRRFAGRFLRGKLEEKKATVLQCMSSRLGVTNATGLNEPALDALLESLSSNTTFTDQLKDIASACIDAMNNTLTADQQGVYVLSCLKGRQKADCLLQNENSTLCLSAKTLKKCPIGIKSLTSSFNFMACKMSGASGLIVPRTDLFSGGDRPDLDSSLCPTLEERAKSIANCSLQAAGLASGDTMDLTAVETAINSSPDTSDAEKARQLDVLNTCQTNGADTVEAFLDCWATEAADGCVISQSERLARAFRPSGRRLRTTSRRQRGRRGRRFPFFG